MDPTIALSAPPLAVEQKKKKPHASSNDDDEEWENVESPSACSEKTAEERKADKRLRQKAKKEAEKLKAGTGTVGVPKGVPTGIGMATATDQAAAAQPPPPPPAWTPDMEQPGLVPRISIILTDQQAQLRETMQKTAAELKESGMLKKRATKPQATGEEQQNKKRNRPLLRTR